MKLFKSFGAKTNKESKTAEGSEGTGSNSPSGGTLRSDVSLPRKERRRSSFLKNHNDIEVLELPSLEEAPPSKKEELFKQKLRMCSASFNYEDSEEDAREKEIKKNTLVELVEYVNSPSG
jgi:serine/threonine-protein phosphatase 2A regulatory subunit B'